MNTDSDVDKRDTSIEKFSGECLNFLYMASNGALIIFAAVIFELVITYGVGVYSTDKDVLQLSPHLFCWEIGSLVVFLSLVAVCGQVSSCGYKQASRLIFILSIFFWVILTFVTPGILHHYLGYNL